MKRISTFVLILLFSVLITFPVFADEIVPSETETTIPEIEESIPPEEEGTIEEVPVEVEEENEEPSENMEMFSEGSSGPPVETECYYDENQNFWCIYSDGSTVLKTPNPFFTKLATYDQTSNFLSLSASINGTTIQTNGPNIVPLNRSVDMKVSFSRTRENETFAPYQGIPLVYDDVINAAVTQFIFFKGEIGKAEIISVASAGYGGIEFQNSDFVFSDPGHYFVVATPGYYSGRYVPGLTTESLCIENPDECIVPQFNYTRFSHFLSTGIADEGNTRGTGLTEPVLYGIIEFDIVETPKASSVLFLPGIKGSKLWMGKDGCDFFIFGDCDEELLWAPGGHQDIKDLFLNTEGRSLNKVYAKKGEILDTAHGMDFYASFLEMLSSLKAESTIADFEAVPYDWRLSLDDIVNKGVEQNGKIFYEESTTTPYIEKELRRLADTSQTGKVTIVAHSNGGLVAKALLSKIGDTETSALIDNVIMVGVPQSGAPQSIGALLFGYGEALPADECSGWFLFGRLCSLLSSRDLARTMAESSPAAYHLLPTSKYFERVQDTEHPVVKFSGTHAYAQDFALYGDTIDNWSELSRFLRADEGTRTKPAANDIVHPNILNAGLLLYAESVHENGLDAWRPPTGVMVYQIAGWGVDTISGVEFTEQPTPYLQYIPLYRPMFVEDGDGVVPVPSALMMSISDKVKNLWMNISSLKKDHSNLFEVENLNTLIRNILTKNESLPAYFTNYQPKPINESKKLRFMLYAEAALKIEDEEGNITGPKDDGTIEVSIPNSNYDEFGGTKIITIPEKKNTYKIKIQATTTAENITLDIEKVRGSSVTKRSTVTNVPIVPEQIISFEVQDEFENITPLVVEETQTEIVSFEEGETVVYGMATSTPSVETENTGGGGGTSSHISPVKVSTSTKTEMRENSTPKIAKEEYTDPDGILFQKEKSLLLKEVVIASSPTSTNNSHIQTASVYDAFVHIASWLKDLLYTILRSLFSFFHIPLLNQSQIK